MHPNKQSLSYGLSMIKDVPDNTNTPIIQESCWHFDGLLGFIINLVIRFFLLVPSSVTDFFRERKIKKFFKRRNRRKFNINCTVIENVETPQYTRAETGFGELVSYGNLKEILTYAFHDNRKVIEHHYIYKSSEMPADHYGMNIISIGGATYNKFAKFIKDNCKLDWWVQPFDEKDEVKNEKYYYEIKDTKEKLKAKPKDGKEGKLDIDYGLITKWPNPKEPQSTIIIIDGLHTCGLIGAGDLLHSDNLNKIYKIAEKFKERKFQLLVTVEFKEDVPYIKCVRYFSSDHKCGEPIRFVDAGQEVKRVCQENRCAVLANCFK